MIDLGSIAIRRQLLSQVCHLHQAFKLAGGGVAGYSNFPPIVDVPTLGCWRFRVKSGVVAGTVTLRVVG